MNIRPYWQFYKAIFPYTISFGLIVLLVLGVLWGFLLFVVLGVPIGFFSFHTFRKDEFYFYQNLGITKLQLAKVSFFINLLIGLPIFGLIFLLFLLFFGHTSIT